MSGVVLDKSLFRKTLQVVGVRVESKKISSVVKALHGNLLNRPRLRNVVPDPKEEEEIANANAKAKATSTSTSKLILLNERVQDKKTLAPLPEELVKFLHEQSLGFVEHAIELDYAYFSVDYVLAQILPKGLDIPSSFETIGHIAHLNLREGHAPYKNLIGQVILDKNAQIRTVVNKIETIENAFRTFPMEILAGDDDLDVRVRETGALLAFNYGQVYWNSRLQHEHARMIDACSSEDVICDMMCGIGPFAIPLALRGCQVYANDLNPRSYFYLKKNVELNKVQSKVEAFNLDGREFVTTLIADGKQFTQVMMNLPASALEFLDAFVGKFDNWKGALPFIHCYCFSTAEDVNKDVIERAGKIMNGSLDPALVDVHLVRDVAPKKVMLCVSFQLPESIAFSDAYRASKRQKTEHTSSSA